MIDRASTRVTPSASHSGARTRSTYRVMVGTARHMAGVPHAQIDRTDVATGATPNAATGWPFHWATQERPAAKQIAAACAGVTPSGSWQPISRQSAARMFAAI